MQILVCTPAGETITLADVDLRMDTAEIVKQKL